MLGVENHSPVVSDFEQQYITEEPDGKEEVEKKRWNPKSERYMSLGNSNCPVI